MLGPYMHSSYTLADPIAHRAVSHLHGTAQSNMIGMPTATTGPHWLIHRIAEVTIPITESNLITIINSIEYQALYNY